MNLAPLALDAETTYEPVFSADGPVMGFDLLLPATSGDSAFGEMRSVRVPLASVDKFIDPRWRQSMSALAGGA